MSISVYGVLKPPLRVCKCHLLCSHLSNKQDTSFQFVMVEVAQPVEVETDTLAILW